MSVHPAINRDSTSALLNPYPGLRPFAETEQRLFFGRTYQVGEILQRLERTSFAVVTGGSGSGKSSIVNAGVIPALRKRQLASRGDFWLAATFSPKDQPFKNLAAELAKLIEPLDGQSSDELVEDVEQTLLETNSLAGFFERYEDRIILEDGQAPESRASANLLIFCDQFEEIFREQNRDNPEAAQLVDLIVEAYRNQSKYPRLFVMIGMRSEDLHRCAAFIDLPNVINGSVFLTRRLDEAEIVSAIVEPMRLSLRLRGIAPAEYQPVEADPWPFDADVLHRLNLATSAMASDPDHLPLLQHLLSVFWRFLEQQKLPAALGPAPEGHPKFNVSSEDLAHALGFGSANKMDEFFRSHQAKYPEQKWTESWILKWALDQAAEGVKPADRRLQAITGRMFRLLAEVDDRGNYKRRWTSRREILEVCADRAATPEEIDGIIAAFSSPYPFLNARPGLDGKIDVSHESFIRNWTQFTDWLKHERQLAVAYDMLRRKYLARQHALVERAKSAWAKFWFRPSYGVRRDELVQLKEWRDRRSENAAWANRYINGLEGEDPESDRRSADDNQAETFNRHLLRFYQRALLFSYKKAAGWGLTALAIVGIVAVMIELQLQDLRHDREFTSVSGTLASEQIRQLNAERTGVNARELYQKLPLLTASEAMVQSAGKSETTWGWVLDQYRALTFRTNEPRPFYYYARHNNDEIARKALDAAMFPIDKENEEPGPAKPGFAMASARTAPSNEQLKAKCFEKLSKPRALGSALADTEKLLTSDPNAKLAVAPLEPEDGKKIAILPTNQGSLVLLVLSLSNEGECDVRYLQGLSLPPGKLQIDDTLRLIAVNAAESKSESQPSWLYRVWWNRHCSLQENATTGRCEFPFTVEVTGPTLTDRYARIVNQNRVEMESGGKKKQFELRSDHRLTSVTPVSADLFPGEPKPHRCVNQGRFMAFIKEEVSSGSSAPPARTLFVIEEADAEADCKKLPNFDMTHHGNVPKNVIATLSLGYFPIKDIAFSGAQADGGLPDYVYLRRGDAPLLNYRVALSPSKLHCSDRDAARTAYQYPIYRRILENAGFTEDRVTMLRERRLRIPSCPGKWDDDKLPKADQTSR
ncbi:MAG TPA: hypothetical protein VD863_10690 [Bradyrhizobium sp.]|nr:hypothetical protein [Bradyrhizobium sp.]